MNKKKPYHMRVTAGVADNAQVYDNAWVFGDADVRDSMITSGIIENEQNE